MIGVVFQHINQIVEVRVEKNNIQFRTDEYGGAFVPIEGLRLDKKGVEKENPDLKDDKKWREKAIERFKEKVKLFNTEMEKINYLIKELKKCGYKPMIMQRKGFRPQKINE